MKVWGFLAIALSLFAGNLAAQNMEKKGSFGLVIAESFVKFNYTITYLGDSVKPDQLAFRIEIEDAKGFNMVGEIVEAQTVLKNIKNQSLQGKVEKENANSALLLFPKEGSFEAKGKTKLYTEIKGYKLKRDFDI